MGRNNIQGIYQVFLTASLLLLITEVSKGQDSLSTEKGMGHGTEASSSIGNEAEFASYLSMGHPLMFYFDLIAHDPVFGKWAPFIGYKRKLDGSNYLRVGLGTLWKNEDEDHYYQRERFELPVSVGLERQWIDTRVYDMAMGLDLTYHYDRLRTEFRNKDGVTLKGFEFDRPKYVTDNTDPPYPRLQSTHHHFYLAFSFINKLRLGDRFSVSLEIGGGFGYVRKLEKIGNELDRSNGITFRSHRPFLLSLHYAFDDPF